MILIAMYHYMCLTDFVTDVETKVYIGYSLIGFTSTHILINLGLMFFSNVHQIRLRYTRHKLMRKYAKVRAKKLMKREKLRRKRMFLRVRLEN